MFPRKMFCTALNGSTRHWPTLLARHNNTLRSYPENLPNRNGRMNPRYATNMAAVFKQNNPHVGQLIHAGARKSAALHLATTRTAALFGGRFLSRLLQTFPGRRLRSRILSFQRLSGDTAGSLAINSILMPPRPYTAPSIRAVN